jgi:RNA polymerase sigma-70 factor (ECF subfamily)
VNAAAACSSEELDELLTSGIRYALSLTHDRSDAEDLVQDAVTAMLAKRARWEKSYLFTTIRNRFIDDFRREKIVTFVPLDPESDSGSGTFGSVDHFQAARLHGALGSLRHEEREVLFLTIVEGYTADEIARRSRRPRGTVLSLIFRAKGKLRASLGPVLAFVPSVTAPSPSGAIKRFVRSSSTRR